MLVEAQIVINAPRDAVWAAITDVENAASIITGIKNIEILERPSNGLVGLRWRETRILFGDAATVEKRITDAVANESYTTSAQDGGFVFVSSMRLSQGGGGVTVTSSHETRPQGLVARLKALPMVLFKGMIRKAILQDLNDVKTAVERR